MEIAANLQHMLTFSTCWPAVCGTVAARSEIVGPRSKPNADRGPPNACGQRIGQVLMLRAGGSQRPAAALSGREC